MFMLNFECLCLLVVFLSGLVVFTSLHKHILITLLSIEYMVLCIYMCFMYFSVLYSGEIYLVIVFLTFSVCEGVLGLSVLVSIIRCCGNDQVGSLSLFKW